MLTDWHLIDAIVNIYKPAFSVLKLEDVDVNKLKRNMSETVWKRNETFYYVDYPNENNSGFECMTKKNSNDPRKPCRFPYIHHIDKKTSNNFHSIFLFSYSQFLLLVVNECPSDVIANYTYCFTKIRENGTVFISGATTNKVWGMCSKNCKGKLILNSLSLNMKNFVRSKIWARK